MDLNLSQLESDEEIRWFTRDSTTQTPNNDTGSSIFKYNKNFESFFNIFKIK